jgi:hypothetical protein
MLLCLVAIAGCNRDKPQATVDSAAVINTPVTPTLPAIVNTGWDTDSNGPAMLLSVPDNMATAAVVLPYFTDSTLVVAPIFRLDSLSNARFDLFGPSGFVAASVLQINSQKPNSEGCVAWPAGTLTPLPQSKWRIGFVKGFAAGLPLDSLENMSASDSSFITSELARLASAVAEGDDPAFRGLPFAIRHAYRFVLGPTTVVVSDVVRKINEEANPREEHLLLMAERRDTKEGYTVAFQNRVAGSEDVVRTNEILGAVQLLNGRPAVVVSFEYDDGGKVALIERVATAQWRITWRSAYTGC